MSLSPIILSRPVTSLTPSTTHYYGLVDGASNSNGEATVEADAQVSWETSGTLSNLFVVVPTNTSVNITTVNTRKNGAAGAQSVVVPGLGVGTYEDAVNFETISPGELWNTQVIRAAGGFVRASMIGSLFLPSTVGGTLTKHAVMDGNGRSGGTLTRYYAIQGSSDSGAVTESNVQVKIRTAGVWKNLTVNEELNTRTGATTLTSRVNTADGNQVVVIPPATTGIFRDLVNFDTVISGDLVDIKYEQTVVTTNGSHTMQSITSELICPNAGYHLISGGYLFHSVQAGNTYYQQIVGDFGSSDAIQVESDFQSKLGIITALSNLFTIVVNNDLAGDSTITLRKNGADGNQILVVPALAVGYFEDIVNFDVLLDTDVVDYQTITGGAGVTFLQPTLTGVLGTGAASVTTTPASNIGTTTADSGGDVIDGGISVLSRGVCWSVLPNPTIADDFTVDGAGGGVFLSNLTGLLPGTTYFARAYATNIAGIFYGNEIEFTTLTVASTGILIMLGCCAN